jgi:hypothetical protein
MSNGTIPNRRATMRTRALILLAAAVSTAACASTGSTLGSGVADRMLKNPPYYAGAGGSTAADRLAHLPIVYQRGATQMAIFDPSGEAGSPADRLVDEMNARLDATSRSTRLDATELTRLQAPDVQFGCELRPGADCEDDGSDRSQVGSPWMRLAVARPSVRWIGELRRALDEAGADHALVITLEVGQYWPRQRNLRGDKEVRLGSDHVAKVPWLSALDQPVQVLQLTGALVDRDGRAVRIGAEGLMARSTPLLASSVGAQALISDESVDRLRTARRLDLAGQPLVWQAALDRLVAELAGIR